MAPTRSDIGPPEERTARIHSGRRPAPAREIGDEDVTGRYQRPRLEEPQLEFGPADELGLDARPLLATPGELSALREVTKRRGRPTADLKPAKRPPAPALPDTPPCPPDYSRQLFAELEPEAPPPRRRPRVATGPAAVFEPHETTSSDERPSARRPFLYLVLLAGAGAVLAAALLLGQLLR